MAEATYTLQHVVAAMLVGALIGAAAVYYILSQRVVEEKERLYVPEGFDVVQLPPYVFDVIVERSERVVRGG
jgi:CRISPR/Cas system-associated protein Csm6